MSEGPDIKSKVLQGLATGFVIFASVVVSHSIALDLMGHGDASEVVVQGLWALLAAGVSMVAGFLLAAFAAWWMRGGRF